MTRGDRHHAVEIGRLPVEMDRHNRPGARPDGRRNRRGVDGVGVAVHVDQHRRRADGGDRQHRGDERVRRGDDFVAGADAVGAQRQLDGGQTSADSNRVARADERGVFGFELFDGRARE